MNRYSERQSGDASQAPILLLSLVKQLASLMRGEVTLARAEIGRNLSRARTGLILVLAGAVVALSALDVLLSALLGWLAQSGVSVVTAALLVGGGLLFAAVVLFAIGSARLTAQALTPSTTLTQVKADIETLKEAVNGGRNG